jgi:hypothetical protein
VQFNDVGNALFEFIGAIVAWMNCIKIRKDKKVRGVYWPIWMFYSLWGIWNLYYYPSVNCWWSFAAGAILTVANVVWALTALRYRNN